MKRTKAEIKISVVRTEITINILSTTADSHYSYCRQQEPMVGEGEGGRGKRERGEKEGGEGERRDKENDGERRRKMGRESKQVSWGFTPSLPVPLYQGDTHFVIMYYF